MSVGKVYLVGAGPGDPGLLTVRGLELLRKAEVVVYDRLANPVLLEEVPAGAIRVFAGKSIGYHSLPQAEINSLLVGHARAGRRVIRLKGGDPFVFGRGGEEALALTEAGIPFEIVPGVTSIVAVPAYAGIPLTQRGYSSSFAVVTGHEACKTAPSIDWSRLATGVDTLVILMGLNNLDGIAAQLIAHGRSAKAPAAAVQCGTTEQQVTITGTLADIAERTRNLTPPVTVVVGEVVRLSGRLGWFSGASVFPSCQTEPVDRSATPIF